MDSFRSVIRSSALLAAFALAACGGGGSGGNSQQLATNDSPDAASAEQAQALVDDCGAPDASAIFSDVFDRDLIGPGWVETGAAATIDHDVGCPGPSLKLSGNPAQAKTSDSFASLNRAFTIDMRLDPGAGESDSASFTVVQVADDANAGIASVKIESGKINFTILNAPGAGASANAVGGHNTGTISSHGDNVGGVSDAAAGGGGDGASGAGSGGGTGGTGGAGVADAGIDGPITGPGGQSTVLQIGNDGLFHRYRFTIDASGKAVWAKGSPGDVYQIILTCDGFGSAGPMIMKVAGTAAHFDNASVSALP